MADLQEMPNNDSHSTDNENRHTQESADSRGNEPHDIGNYSGAIQRCLRNFILGKKIGAGTFSKVCIAKHKLTNEHVAIKIIEKSKVESEADRIRLDREIKIMRKARHPNIAQLYQIIETTKYIYLVMEHAARGELFDHIVSHQKLSELEACKFLLQLTDAIEYLHQMGIAHRDLKPENLLLDHKYNLKVTDFGLSNIYPAGKFLSTACGSPSYACPQMINGSSYDGLKADIWSIGIVLYAMCFGFLPFDNPNIGQLYNMIKKGEFQVPESASEELADLLNRILETDPNERATISQIRNHSFCKFSNRKPIPGIIVGLSDIPFESAIEKEMRDQLHVDTQHLREEIKKNKHNEDTCTYYLLLQRWLRSQSQSLSNYYMSNYNVINRYALVEKVKANYDKLQRHRMEVRKFHIVQEQIVENDRRAKQNPHIPRQERTTKKDKRVSVSKKIMLSAQDQPNLIGNMDPVQQQDQIYLKSQMKHFAPNNTKLIQTDPKPKNRLSKTDGSQGKGPSKSKSKSNSRSKSKQRQKNMEKAPKTRVESKKTRKSKDQKVKVPREFLSHKKSEKLTSENKRSKQKASGSGSGNKGRIKTLEKEDQNRRRRSSSQGIKLRF